jgi:hypothetical protein
MSRLRLASRIQHQEAVMLKVTSHTAVLVVFVALGWCDASGAQTTAPSFNDIEAHAKQDVVEVSFYEGRRVTGHILTSANGSLTLEQRDGQTVVFAEPAVRKVIRRDSRSNGAAIGFLAGAAPGALLGCIFDNPCDRSGRAIVWGAAIGFGSIGAVVGASIDALINHEIYRGPTRSTLRLSVAPALAATRSGLSVSLSF